MHHFCTYFDIHYLPRARALHASLLEHCADFHLHALCLDDASLARLRELQLPCVTPIALADLERANPALLQVKAIRTPLEYFYTCGPSLPLFVFQERPEAEVVTYVDADLYFFSSPQPLFDALADHSIGVMAHRLPAFRQPQWQGVYNVGWLSFRRDRDGIACLEWWRDRCLEWCYERREDGKYADQLYLDQWPKLFPGFYEYTHHGANVAIWNVNDYRLSLRNGQVCCDTDPLVFYHFAGLKQVSRHVFNTNLSFTLRPPHPILRRYIYLPYILRLQAFAGNADPTASIRRYRVRAAWKQWMRDVPRVGLGLALRQYVVVKAGKIF